MNHLLHPELVQSIPITGDWVASALDNRAAEAAADMPPYGPITVGIRTFNEAPKLERLLQDVAKQVVSNEVEIVVVDNESTDHTKDVVREYGAELVTLPRGEFTYPRSMNLAMEAASHDTVFLTVAHTLLSSDRTLHAGARHFRPDSDVAGVYSTVLPTENASRSDRWLDVLYTNGLFRSPQRIRKATIGVMAATGAMFSRAVWDELGRFDEAYETGGEDTALARTMLANGYEIVSEPALSVHHAHGLSLVGNIKELRHFAETVRGPRPLQGEIRSRRQARFETE